MATELEKQTQDFKARKYSVGSKILKFLTRGLISKRMGELPEEPINNDLPPFKFIEPAPSRVYQIDALSHLSKTTRNILALAGMTDIRKLYNTLDSDILKARQMGPEGLDEVRKSLSAFRERIISERQLFGITDNRPIEFPYPNQVKT
jgi:hypothetical protein